MIVKECLIYWSLVSNGIQFSND